MRTSLLRPTDALFQIGGFKKPAAPVLIPYHPINRGLKGRWLCGDSASGILQDISPYGNDGSIINPPAERKMGRRGGLASYFGQFGVSNSYADCGNRPSLDITGDLTIGAWIWFSGGTFPRLMSKMTNPITITDGYELVMYGVAGRPYFQVANGGVLNSAVSAIGYTQFVWMHLMATYAALTGTGTLYINGAVQATFVSGGAIGSSSANLCLGAYPGGANDVAGIVEDAVVYNRVLSPGEVRRYVNEPFVGVYDASLPKTLAFPVAKRVRTYVDVQGQ